MEERKRGVDCPEWTQATGKIVGCDLQYAKRTNLKMPAENISTVGRLHSIMYAHHVYKIFDRCNYKVINVEQDRKMQAESSLGRANVSM